MTNEVDTARGADKVDEVVSTLKVCSNHVGESAAQSHARSPSLSVCVL